MSTMGQMIPKSTSKIYIRSIFPKQIAHNTMEAPGLDSSADGAGYIYWNALFVIEPSSLPPLR